MKTAAEAISHEETWNIGVTRLFGTCDLDETGLKSGWSTPEVQHMWNDGPEAILQIEIGLVRKALRLSVEVVPFIGGSATFQDVSLYVNGGRLGFWRLTDAKPYTLTAVVEPEHIFERSGRGVLNCAFHLPGSVRPIDVGAGKDTRNLGVCFRTITLT